MRRVLSHLVCCFLLVACCKSSLSSERAAAERFAEIRKNPLELTMFLRRMPKGGDLHSHLSGAIYAESFVRWAADAKLCLDIATWKLETKDCGTKHRLIADILRDSDLDPTNRARLINALSMRNYIPGQGMASAHDQFFGTFPRFGAATDQHGGDMIAEVTSRAAAQNINYLELMISLHNSDVVKSGIAAGWNGETDTIREKYEALKLDEQIPAGKNYLDEMEHQWRDRLKCGRPGALPGCDVTVRFIGQVSRQQPLPIVFAQAAFAFRMADQDRRVVGINFVQYEDHPDALANYTTHMRLVKELSTIFPKAHVSLHAGELNFGLVPPEELRMHIRQAVEIAGAERIGHGVDIAYEDNAADLLARMAKDKIAVEINLTSNDVILGVRGNRHPFELYRRAGVPLVLSTDDEGVSRIDLSHEYQRAAETYELTYRDLKELARNSLTYSFLSGASLWSDARRMTLAPVCAGAAPGSADEKKSAPCDLFLNGSDKARQQWRLEAEFVAFERAIAAQRSGARKN